MSAAIEKLTNKRIFYLIGTQLIIVALLLYLVYINKGSEKVSSLDMKEPDASFYFIKDGMPCLAMVFIKDSMFDRNDFGVSCDWSQWDYNVKNIGSSLDDPAAVPQQP